MRIENLEKLVVKTTNDLANIERFIEFLAFMGHGNLHNFSVENQLAIFGQAPDASVMADFEQWKKIGRYPLMNSGISVYPFNSNGVFKRFSDCLFDLAGTKGREIKPWKISDEQRNNLVHYFYGSSPESYKTYFRNYIQRQIEADIINGESELVFPEDNEKTNDVCNFISECSYKVYMERIDVPYELSQNAKSCFNAHLAPDGKINMPLFNKCLSYVQSISHMLIGLTGSYVITENRREKENAESRNRDYSEQRNIADTRIEGNETLSKYDRGRSIKGSEYESDRNLPGIRGNHESPMFTQGTDDIRLSENEISGTDSNHVTGQHTGRIHSESSEGSRGDVRSAAPNHARRGEGLGDGYHEENSEGESDLTGFVGDYPDGSPIQASPVLESKENQGADRTDQLDLISYLSQMQEDDETADVNLNKQKISNLSANDFYYDDEWVPNTGSDRERFERNIEAIRVLKGVEAEGRNATEEEQKLLSQYVGWGGLSKYFDERESGLSEQRNILKSLFTEDEYASAMSTVTDSFYTPKEVIQGVYAALERFGFRGGNILEPAMGIGNFYSGMPQSLASQSSLYGVELDYVSGRIAKLLHPNCHIQICVLQVVLFVL